LTQIPGAVWIWTPGASADTLADRQRVFFSRTFYLDTSPSGWIDFAADNTGDIRVDGQIVGSIGDVVDNEEAALAHSRLTRFDLTPFLHPGTNVITISAENAYCPRCPDHGRTLAGNPAGVVFGGSLSGAR
jgi:hypothetical protein